MKMILCFSVLAGLLGCQISQAVVDEEQTQGQDLLAEGQAELWEPIGFGAEGEVWQEDGQLHMDMGSPLTGVVYTGEVQAILGETLENYEISYEGQRVEGYDFFAGCTFPVGEEGHLTLVLGGWAGSVCGLSNLNWMDASENATTFIRSFESQQWYAIRIRVTAEAIVVWLDDEQIIEVNRADYERFTLRGEVLDTAPFGFCSYMTHGTIRNVRVRQLDTEE